MKAARTTRWRRQIASLTQTARRRAGSWLGGEALINPPVAAVSPRSLTPPLSRGLPLADRPMPFGWYVVCFSSELSVGQVVSKKLFGHEWVVFRTEGGRVGLLDAHCPHMGANFAHGGTVEGEVLRCPFHGFCFTPEGECVSTPYKRRLPRASTTGPPVEEHSGVVLMWFHPQGDGPTFGVPRFEADGYGPLYEKVFEPLKSHPQETTENSVDLGHLGEVHGYTEVCTITPLATEGPVLRAGYSMQRANPFLPGSAPVHATFDVSVNGLGHSWVKVGVEQLGIRSRHFVFSTPIDPGHIELRIALQTSIVDPRQLPAPLRLMPRRVAQAILSELAMVAYINDVSQDFRIWKNKVYVDPPALAEGDGPVGVYRNWAKQFYVGENTKSTRATA